MSEPTAPRPDAPKADPETLVLKAAPRRVVRFKRRLVIGIAAVACVAVFGVTWLALKGPAMRFGCFRGGAARVPGTPEQTRHRSRRRTREKVY